MSFVLGLIMRNVPGHRDRGASSSRPPPAWSRCWSGLYAQMVSATREQRILIVTGMIAGFVGLALGLAHGGFLA